MKSHTKPISWPCERINRTDTPPFLLNHVSPYQLFTHVLFFHVFFFFHFKNSFTLVLFFSLAMSLSILLCFSHHNFATPLTLASLSLMTIDGVVQYPVHTYVKPFTQSSVGLFLSHLLFHICSLSQLRFGVNHALVLIKITYILGLYKWMQLAQQQYYNVYKYIEFTYT